VFFTPDLELTPRPVNPDGKTEKEMPRLREASHPQALKFTNYLPAGSPPMWIGEAPEYCENDVALAKTKA